MSQDGTASTIRGACMVVRDVTDFCFHSYFSFMDELSEKMGDDETPIDIKYVISNISIAYSCRGNGELGPSHAFKLKHWY